MPSHASRLGWLVTTVVVTVMLASSAQADELTAQAVSSELAADTFTVDGSEVHISASAPRTVGTRRVGDVLARRGRVRTDPLRWARPAGRRA